MRVALDTNILVYAEGVNGMAAMTAASELIARLPAGAGVLPGQTLAELFELLVRKANRSRQEAHASVLSWRNLLTTFGASSDALVAALDLAAHHQLRIWDSLVLATAAEASCKLLLSEDIQEGFTWRGVTVTNPFAARRHPLLEALLSSDRGAR